MNKSIKEQDFFAGSAEEVARDLLGKYICRNGGKEKYLIVETEAYYQSEDFCYGHGKTKKEAQRLVSAPLFNRPGTWCVYGGQLLVSVTDDVSPDNVLIKKVKNEAGEILGPDRMARSLHLYKSKPDYCGCHGQYSLSADVSLYLIDGEKTPQYSPPKQRVNIKDPKKLNFRIDGE